MEITRYRCDSCGSESPESTEKPVPNNAYGHNYSTVSFTVARPGHHVPSRCIEEIHLCPDCITKVLTVLVGPIKPKES
jgi:hypothetical protein